MVAQIDASNANSAGLPGVASDRPAGFPQRRANTIPEVGDHALVAALTNLPLPSYISPAQPQSVGWSRNFGAVRSGKVGTRVEAAAPSDHTGLSLSAAPRLWWRLDGATEHAIQLTIVNEDSIDPLLLLEIPGPQPAGQKSVDLSQHNIALEPGIEYRWFVTLVGDADRPSRNPVSEGAIRVVDDSDSRRAEVADTSAPMKGHMLAKLGIWYDAYDFFSVLALAHPEATAVARHRDRLMEIARSK